MVKLKLNLKSAKQSSIYTASGKVYTLNPGTNTLMLSYKDYLEVAKVLGIKPVSEEDANNDKKVDSKKTKKDKHVEENKSTVEDKVEDNVEDKSAEENKYAEEIKSTVEDKIEDKVEDKPADEDKAENKVEDSIENKVEDKPAEKDKTVDYTTWSYSKLKSEYKKVTGKACKLKKDEIIKFLQG